MDSPDKQPRKIKKADSLATRKKRNPKAFAINAPKAAERRFRRKQDLEESRFHVPLANRTPLEPPPVVVAVVGPPLAGKTTLIKSLVKYYTRYGLNEANGPITIVSGKKRRITLIECNNDVYSMVDVAKVADLVLLMVDASFGFEMELFEFLNICQAHGFPKIMAVLTHLDLINTEAEKKRVKKMMKKRFWTEIYKGAKLSFVSGVVHGIYNKRDTQNIARHVSVMKFRPLSWQTSHPYIVVDRVEDLTDPQSVQSNRNVDRHVSMYGFVRGMSIVSNSDVHIPGGGDFRIENISKMPDPCPLPKKTDKQRGSLNQKERMIYAPFCGVGGVLCDKDAVYIDVAGSHSFADRIATHESDNIVNKILQSTQTIDDKMKESTFQFFTRCSPEEEQPAIREEYVYDEDEDEDGLEQLNDEELAELASIENDEYDEGLEDDEDDEFMKVRPGLAEENFLRRKRDSRDIQRFVYGGPNGFKHIYSGLSSEFNDVQNDGIMRPTENSMECTNEQNKSVPNEHGYEKLLSSIRDKFVTGKWSDEENAFRGDQSESDIDMDEEGEAFDDFEDLEAGTKFNAEDQIKQLQIDAPHDDEGIAEDDEQTKARMLAKLRKKSQFDAQYDAGDVDIEAPPEKTFYDMEKEKLQKQTNMNREFLQGLDEDTRLQVEGYRPGLYVRFEFKAVPSALIDNFNPSYPLIVGGLNPGEIGEGFIRVRLKKHRWYKKILKTRDPLIISMGWRRFQTSPVYHVMDENMRNRVLKYTPWHLHCLATFWAPFSPQGTGLVAIRQSSEFTEDFRISASGVVIDLNKATDLKKKLKLVGSPMEIFTKTAFIRGMFNSSLEVEKFVGSQLRTVSGIRGLIKKPIRNPPGAFRATFEDKILMSDIVFMRTWVSVVLEKRYVKINTLLMPTSDRVKWQGARTIGQIRFENREVCPADSTNPDSIYKKVERKKFNFRPFAIPKNLQRELPFKHKPKFIPSQTDKIERVSAIKSEEEKKRLEALIMMGTLHKERLRRSKQRKQIAKQTTKQAKK